MGGKLDLYNSVRDNIRTGDAVLWKSKSLVGFVIQKFCKSPYNHVSMAVRFTEFDVERVYLLESLGNGPVLLPLSMRLEEHDGKAWVFPLHPDFNIVRRPMTAWALKNQGKKYDYGTLFKNAIARVSKDARRFICSEYYQMALESGANDMGVSPDKFKAAYDKLEAVYKEIPKNKAWRPSDWPLLVKTGVALDGYPIL